MMLHVSSIVNVAVLITAQAPSLSAGTNTLGTFWMGTSTNETSVSGDAVAGKCPALVISA